MKYVIGILILIAIWVLARFVEDFVGIGPARFIYSFHGVCCAILFHAWRE